MLGLLLLAGMGIAATAIVELVDVASSPQDEEEDPEALAENGDLLDEIDESDTTEADAAILDADPPEDEPPEDEPPAEEASAEEAPSAGDGDAPADEALASGDETSGDVSDAWPETAGDHAAGEDPSTPPADDATAPDVADAEAAPESMAMVPPAPTALTKIYGGATDDRLSGTDSKDYIDGQGGDDLIEGKGGADHLVTLGEGQDTAFGGLGNDTLHGYTVNRMPGGDTSFVIEDHESDVLRGGGGADKLFVGSGDRAQGGAGADEFHLSWDVDPDTPARIGDYQPGTDRIVVEFTTNRADDDMTPISDADQNLTTVPLHDGSGTAICLNGQPIAHVMGTTTLQASDIRLVHV